MGADDVEKFVATPELQSEDSITDDPLPPGQTWVMSGASTRIQDCSGLMLPKGQGAASASSTSRLRHLSGRASSAWPLPALEQAYRASLRTIEEPVARLSAGATIYVISSTSRPCGTRVVHLRCFRGIDDLTALTIAAELGDPRRFPTAASVMAFVGLVPSEYSSGGKRARGAITKTGNAHVRRVVVEAAWHYRHHPFVGERLRTRQQAAPAQSVALAWTAQHRLGRRVRRLAARGKARPTVVTAVARELTGFLWAALTP